MIERVKNFINKEKMINGGETVLAGVSGGADSVCLFFILMSLSKELSFNLEVIHINHMIRKEAEGEAFFVEKLCEKYNIPFHRKDVDIPRIFRESGLSEEEAGRIERYKAFEEIADKIEKEKGTKVLIATAHNTNDQAETMLHNLFRGTKLKGLSGIKPVRKHGNHTIIRPILPLSRSEIEEYLHSIGQDFCVDQSNNTDEFTRNRIRHNILPVAEKEINKGAVRHVAEAAAFLSEIDDYIEDKARMVLNASSVTKDGELTIDLNKLQDISPFVKERLMMLALKEILPGIKDITAAHIDALIEMAENSAGTKSYDLPYKITVTRAYNKMSFYKKDKAEKQEDKNEEGNYRKVTISKNELTKNGKETFDLPGLGEVRLCLFPADNTKEIPTGEYTKWLDYDKINNTMSFRTREKGDRISVSNGTKTLKKLMIDEKIPAHMREELIIFADDEEVIWIPGFRINDKYKIGESTSQILAVEVTNLQLVKGR